MDALLHDERLRLVLRQVPQFLSDEIPLPDKLAELCRVATEALRADEAAVLVVEDGAPELVHTDGVAPEALRRLEDADHMASVLDGRGVVHDTVADVESMVVPLHSNGESFGALHVERVADNDGFDTDEEALLDVIAEVLGPAVHHGVTLRNTRRAQHWSRAAVTLAERFLLGDVDDPLAEVVGHVFELGEADAVSVMVPVDDQHVAVAAIRGLGLEDLASEHVSIPSRFTLDVMAQREGVLVDLQAQAAPWLEDHRPGLALGPMMAVPLKGAQAPIGVLYLLREAGKPPYSPTHRRIAETFAVNAAVSVEWYAARQTQDELRMLQERNRIARDLHDNVVQRLFATGLYLQQASRSLEGEVKQRVVDAMTAIDQTIRQIRNTILVLRSTAADRLDEKLTTIVAETAPLLGFPPRVRLSPDVSRVTGPLAADLALCVREALSNIVQHARASAVELDVAVEGGALVLEISDDGVGIQGPRRPGGGLENLDERARAHGGTFSYTSDAGQGTTLRWRMPLSEV